MAVLQQSESREKSIRFPVQGANVRRRTHVSLIEPPRARVWCTDVSFNNYYSWRPPKSLWTILYSTSYKTSGGTVTCRRVRVGSKHTHSVAYRWSIVSYSGCSTYMRANTWVIMLQHDCSVPETAGNDRFKSYIMLVDFIFIEFRHRLWKYCLIIIIINTQKNP